MTPGENAAAILRHIAAGHLPADESTVERLHRVLSEQRRPVLRDCCERRMRRGNAQGVTA